MPEISGIRETKRGRFALFSEGEFLFSVDGETLMQYDIQEGSSLSDGELSSLKEHSDTRKAKDQAFRFLARRAHGRRELLEKLCRKHDEYSATAAVEAMEALGLIDDAEFAGGYAREMAGKGKSSREIRQKLQALGLGQEVVEEAVEALDLDDTETALKILRKQYMDRLAAGKQQAVMAALARRGFSHSDIKAALAAAREELETPAEAEQKDE